ncbi:MAG: hypothetical protein AAGP08_10335 [Pseudomonadota bacterium]
MTAQLLTRMTHRAPNRPGVAFLGDLSLSLGRVHEITGPARRTLTALIAAKMQGPIFWIAPAWHADRLNPEGICRLFHPGRLTFLDPMRAEDLLWTMEEVLRSGAVPLVVADLATPPALTPVRRLHLAAETGHATTGHWPLGLILTPDQGGAPGVESRWHLSPRHQPGAKRSWRLDRLRARTAPQQSWEITAAAGQFHAAPTATEIAC